MNIATMQQMEHTLNDVRRILMAHRIPNEESYPSHVIEVPDQYVVELHNTILKAYKESLEKIKREVTPRKVYYND